MEKDFFVCFVLATFQSFFLETMSWLSKKQTISSANPLISDIPVVHIHSFHTLHAALPLHREHNVQHNLRKYKPSASIT